MSVCYLFSNKPLLAPPGNSGDVPVDTLSETFLCKHKPQAPEIINQVVNKLGEQNKKAWKSANEHQFHSMHENIEKALKDSQCVKTMTKQTFEYFYTGSFSIAGDALLMATIY